VSVYPWTTEDVSNFMKYVAKHGGEVRECSFTRDGGIEAAIACPPNEAKGWGEYILRSFEGERLASRKRVEVVAT
jgi:hypothetical protein